MIQNYLFLSCSEMFGNVTVTIPIYNTSLKIFIVGYSSFMLIEELNVVKGKVSNTHKATILKFKRYIDISLCVFYIPHTTSSNMLDFLSPTYLKK